MESNPESRPINKADAIAFIEIAKAECGGTGGTDSEWYDLESIKKAVEDDAISPEEAVRRVEAIIKPRQNYH